MNYALKLDNVCKTYETSDFLLDNVSFEVPMGSVMGFVGENGAGKTTTIGCILNTLFRNSGSIQIFEKEMKDEDTVLRNDIGVVMGIISRNTLLPNKFPRLCKEFSLNGIIVCFKNI